MRWWNRLRHALFDRDKEWIDFDKELQSDLELETEEQQARGLPAAEARQAAVRAFGNRLSIHEDVREVWRRAWMERLLQDLRYATRMLLRSPGFTAVAILTLAVGIGATTAIFSRVNAVFFKTLPVKNPEELRIPAWSSERSFADVGFQNVFLGDIAVSAAGFSYPAYQHVRDATTSFGDLACWQQIRPNPPVILKEQGRVEAQFISGNYFRTLGIDVVLGRTITPDDDESGRPPVVVLSYGLWQRVFGGALDVLDRSVNINGTSFAIVGIMHREFFGFDPSNAPDVMVPVAMQALIAAAPRELRANRDWGACQIIGRLRPGVADEQARAETEKLVRQAILDDPPPQEYEMPQLALTAGGQGLNTLRRTAALPFRLLMAIAGLVLAITCANIAGLLLSRGTVREKEIATRLALGSPRGRIIRQLLTESLLLSIIGGSLGISLAFALNRFIEGLLGLFMPTPLGTVRTVGVSAGPDLRILVFSIVLVVLTGLLFGVMPAFRAARVDLISIMRGTSSRAIDRKFRLAGTKGMVALQVGVSMMLLIGAGLFVRTLIHLTSEPLGYEPKGLLFFRVDTASAGYSGSRRMDFFENTVKRLESAPGVTSATGSAIPMIGVLANVLACIPGYVSQTPSGRTLAVNTVAPRFFETWKLPVLDGRDVEWRDREGTPRVALVNDVFAKKFYAGKNPVGQTLGLGTPCRDTAVRVIGVVADSKANPRQAAVPTIYLPYRQLAVASMTFTLRTAGEPSALVPTIRRIMNELDAGVPIFDSMTPVELREQLTKRERLFAGLLIFFGCAALLLASVGIYGMLAYAARRRTSEIAIRLALGARRQNVVRMIVRESLLPVIAGILLGWIGASALARFIGGLLFGISNNDPLSVAAAAVLLIIIASVAAFIPAARASRIDPLRALRYE